MFMLIQRMRVGWRGKSEDSSEDTGARNPEAESDLLSLRGILTVLEQNVIVSLKQEVKVKLKKTGSQDDDKDNKTPDLGTRRQAVILRHGEVILSFVIHSLGERNHKEPV